MIGLFYIDYGDIAFIISLSFYTLGGFILFLANRYDPNKQA
ncbi:hypothetical protein BGP_4291 [Beggiatoa sp. PS]|nr:hypothetical protein BGP_4291 [Beggiatoa sp. PS]